MKKEVAWVEEEEEGVEEGVTFFLFSLMPLVAFVDALDGADGQDDGDDEEEDASDDAGRHRLLFQPFGQRERGLLARRLRRQRVRVHPKHVLLPHVQLLHCSHNSVLISTHHHHHHRNITSYNQSISSECINITRGYLC